MEEIPRMQGPQRLLGVLLQELPKPGLRAVPEGLISSITIKRYLRVLMDEWPRLKEYAAEEAALGVKKEEGARTPHELPCPANMFS